MRPVYLASKTSYPGVIHLPVLSIEFLNPFIDFSLYDGVVVTSKQGASALETYSCDWERLEAVCVGEATAKELKRIGVIHLQTAEGYGESITQSLSGSEKKWLYLRPEAIASAWPDQVRQSGVELDEVTIYRTVCNESADPVSVDPSGIVIFTSPSSIECFLKRYTLLPSHTVIVIGKTTQKALPNGVTAYLSKETSVASCVELAGQIDSDSSPF